jgi:hypothetical protein
MQHMFPCPKCGAQNPVGQRFCGACGQKLQYNCPHCGGLIDPAFRFCPNCRVQLGWGIQQQPRGMPQQPTWAPPVRRSQRSSATPVLVLVLIVLLVGLGGVSYWAFGPSLGSSSVQSGSESYWQPTSESDPYRQYPSEFEAHGQPPYLKASGQRIHLTNNPDARDVSFAELNSFLLEDDTDEKIYVPGVRMCGAFAETLHDNAERAGIRAAWVGVDFDDDSIGHALNGFQTTDRGFVYIDCTGEGLRPVTQGQWLHEEAYPCENDKVAYVDIGKEYGVISIDNAQLLRYSFYIDYSLYWQKCEDMLEEYNDEVARYNEEISGKVYQEGSPELAAIEAWEAELHEKERMLDDLAQKLGNCWFEPLGIVETVEIYW